MTRPRCFLDLDNCLYDTEALMAPILTDLEHITGSPEAVREALKELIDLGYFFERHLELLGHAPEIVAAKGREYHERLALGDAFLYPDVADGVRTLSAIADCYLLTFGYQPYQKSKFNGIPTLNAHLLDAHFVWKDRTKGDVLRDHGETDQDVYFIDDSPPHLEDAIVKAPWVRVVRMLRPGVTVPHKGDGKDWPVVASFTEFVTMVQVGRELNDE